MTSTSNFSGFDPDKRNTSRVLAAPGGKQSFSLFGGGESTQEAPTHRRGGLNNPKNSTSKENFFDQPGAGASRAAAKPSTPPQAAQPKPPTHSDPIRPQQPEPKPAPSVKKNISSIHANNGHLTAGYLEPTISFLSKSRYVNHVHTPRDTGGPPVENGHSQSQSHTSGACFCTNCTSTKCTGCSSQQDGGQKKGKMVNEAGQSSEGSKPVQRRTGRARRPQQVTAAGQISPHKSYYNPQLAIMDPMTAHPVRSVDRDKLRTSAAEFRDPILGYGDFGEELDLLSTGIRRPKTAESDQGRDPILGLGNLGEEMDPLQRSPRVPKKRLASPPNKVVRNPVLGEGDLGSEYDPVWRTAYSPGARKHHQAPVRDPIKGSGEMRTYDPVRKGPALKSALKKLNSEQNIKGNNKENKDSPRRDPILGKELAQAKPRMMFRMRSVDKDSATRNPISGEGDFHEDDKKRRLRRPKTPTKMDNEDYALLDPIGHRGDGDRALYVGSGPHTPRDRARTPTRMSQSYRNCIVGEGDLGPDSTFNRPRRSKSCPRRVRGRNRDGTETENTPPPASTATQRRHTYKRADSNPVTGAGEDLKTWDIRRSNRPRTPRPHSESSNPLTGDNCKCFDISLEQRSRMPSSAKNQASNNNPFVRENHNNYNGYSGNQNDTSFTSSN